MTNWKNKIVVITGGSAGLGFAIAQAFGKFDAKPILIGRNEARCRSAVQALANQSIIADFETADVTNQQSATTAIDQIVDRHQQIDVFINNAGRSIRVDLMKATVEQYRELMEVNFFAAVSCTQHVLPILADSSGHLVNIGSLSSRTAWPFLGPYTTSKYALAGYTHQLRLEGPRNVHFMLVCPGPIARDDSGSRYNDESGHVPETALKPGAGARLKGISANYVAKKIVAGCRRRKREIVLPIRARLLFAISSLSPPLGDWISRRMMN